MHTLDPLPPFKCRVRVTYARCVSVVVTLAVIFGTAHVLPLLLRTEAKQEVFRVRVTIVAFDERCDLDRDNVPSGMIELILENHAQHTRAVQLVQSGDTANSRYMGGVAGLQPGASQAVIVPVKPGQVTVICSDSQNKTELARFEITVHPATEDVSLADLDVDLRAPVELGADCTYELLSPVHRESLWTVRNTSEDVQELRVLAVSTGVTRSEIAREFSETGTVPEAMEAGGMALLSPGEEAVLRVGLASGEYLAWCLTYFSAEEFDIAFAANSTGDDVTPEENLDSHGFTTNDPGPISEGDMRALPGVGTALQPFTVVEVD